jgi:hypothetical protein
MTHKYLWSCDQTYQSNPERFFGGSWAVLPSSFGVGDAEKARALFAHHQGTFCTGRALFAQVGHFSHTPEALFSHPEGTSRTLSRTYISRTYSRT